MARPTLEDDPYPVGMEADKYFEWHDRRLSGRRVREIQLLGARTVLRNASFSGRDQKQKTKEEKDTLKYFIFSRFHFYAYFISLPHIDDSMQNEFSRLAGEYFLRYRNNIEAQHVVYDDLAKHFDPIRVVQLITHGNLSMGVRDGAAAFEQDLAILETGGIEALLRAPLWPRLSDEIGEAFAKNHEGLAVQGGMPAAHREQWLRLNAQLITMGDDFEIWAEWYEGILAGEIGGRYIFGLPTAKAFEVQVKMPLIDVSYWPAPEKANAAIKQIVREARKSESAHSAEGQNASEAKPAPSESGKKSRRRPAAPRTKIGKGMAQNAALVALQSALLIPILDREIEALRQARPNSDEAIADRDHQIAALEKLKADTLALKDAPKALIDGDITEKEATHRANAFLQPFRDCWNENGKGFVEIGIRSGLFLGAIAIAKNLGMEIPPVITVTVLGAIAAEKPLSAVLKAGKGMLKFGGFGR